MNGTDFAVSSVRNPARTEVTVAGELDLLTVALLEAELGRVEASRSSPIALDLSRITFFDAIGLQAVLDAHNRARKAARGFAVLNGAAPLLRALERLGYSHLLQARTEA